MLFPVGSFAAIVIVVAVVVRCIHCRLSIKSGVNNQVPVAEQASFFGTMLLRTYGL